MSYMGIEEIIASYPAEDRPVIEAWFARKAKEHEYDCMDCERVALLGDTAQVGRYEAAVGCCGSDDEEVVGPSGARYLVGCNYGH